MGKEANELTSLSKASRNSGVALLNRFKVWSGNSTMKLRTNEYSFIWNDKRGGFFLFWLFPSPSRALTSRWAAFIWVGEQLALSSTGYSKLNWSNRSETTFPSPSDASSFSVISGDWLQHKSSNWRKEERGEFRKKNLLKEAGAGSTGVVGLNRAPRTTDCRHARALLSIMISRRCWNKAQRVDLGSSARACSSLSCDSKDTRKTVKLIEIAQKTKGTTKTWLRVTWKT